LLPLVPPGVYSAWNHHVPVWFTVTVPESAVAAGGLEPLTACVSTGLPTLAWVAIDAAGALTATEGRTRGSSLIWLR
jgi:hypothetical protein